MEALLASRGVNHPGPVLDNAYYTKIYAQENTVSESRQIYKPYKAITSLLIVKHLRTVRVVN